MSRRTLVVLLGVSVALNLFFLGVVAARVWQRLEWRSERPPHALSRGAGHRAGRGPGVSLGWMSEAERRELRPQRQALIGLRRDAEALLRAEPFDAAKFRAALDSLRTETLEIQSSVHEALIRRAENADGAERRQLADASWGRRGDRGRPSRHRD